MKIKFFPLELIGKASWNIFLIQMVFFRFSDMILPDITSSIISVGVKLVICLFFGLLFYFIESSLTKRVIYNIIKSENCVVLRK